MQLKRIVVGASAVLVLGNLVPTSAASTSGKSCWETKRSERKFARKMNAARNRVGSDRIRLDPELSQVARKHTRAMTRKGDIFHSPWHQLQRRVTNWTMLGENVAVGGSVRSVHRAFMNSPGHRDNIERRGYRHVGVGVKKGRGSMWVTVIFQSRKNPGTTLPKPSC